MAEVEPENGKGRRTASRWLKPVLILSLAFNLFVGAVIVGSAIGHHKRPHPGVRDVSFGLFTEALDRDDRKALREAFFRAAPDIRDRRREAREDYESLIAALRADPWRQEQVEETFGAQEARMVERFALGRRLLGERIAQMSPAERAALAERMEDILEDRRRD